jgi:hypothetical protein
VATTIRGCAAEFVVWGKNDWRLYSVLLVKEQQVAIALDKAKRKDVILNTDIIRWSWDNTRYYHFANPTAYLIRL